MARGPRFTQQYVGGILAGLGVGILLGIAMGFDNGPLRAVGRWPVQVLALILLPIGQTMAWKGQPDDPSP